MKAGMAETLELAQQRGDAINQTADASAALAEDAGNFASAARALRDSAEARGIFPW